MTSTHISQEGRKGTDRVCLIRITAIAKTTFTLIALVIANNSVKQHKKKSDGREQQCTKSHEEFKCNTIDIWTMQNNQIYVH